MANQVATLTFDVYVAEGVPVVTSDLPPGEKQRLWSPISATLISGERDAVLADALMTTAQARGLADWIAASGKNLTARLRRATRAPSNHERRRHMMRNQKRFPKHEHGD